MNFFKRGKGPEVGNRRRQPKGLPNAGEFAVETRPEAAGVTLPAPARPTHLTMPLTAADRERVIAATDAIAERVQSSRDYGGQTGSKLHATAADTVERTVTDRLHAAETVGEASDAIFSGIQELQRMAMAINPMGGADVKEFRPLRSTLTEMRDLVLATTERAGMNTAAQSVADRLEVLHASAERSGSQQDMAITAAAARLPSALWAAKDAEEACAVIDRCREDLFAGPGRFALVGGINDLSTYLGSVRNGIEESAGRQVQHLTVAEREPRTA